MDYDAKKEWTKKFEGDTMAWPAEYVIRIFKGKYPNLNLREQGYQNKKICDIGCGDGRNLVVLKECGFDISGMEISSEIVSKVITNLEGVGINNPDIRTGTNDNIPFESDYFDFLLSWNASYYMGENGDFNQYLNEYARVLKREGFLVLSIPKKTCFIYRGSEKINEEYCIIKEDPFNCRNGERFRIFENEDEIEKTLSVQFKNFTFASVHDDCFGFNYHWHIVVCKKK